VLWYQQSLAAYLVTSGAASGAPSLLVLPSSATSSSSSSSSSSPATVTRSASISMEPAAASASISTEPAAAFAAAALALVSVSPVSTSTSRSTATAGQISEPLLPALGLRVLVPAVPIRDRVETVAVLRGPSSVGRPPRPSSAPPPSSADRQYWLDSSLADSSLKRYRSRWEDWCDYAASHGVSALPPDEYAVEQYICDRADLTGSMSAVNASVFAINHYCSRNKFVSSLQSPYFALVLRGIGNKIKKLPVPREPFSAGHIRSLMDLARGSQDDLRVWRGVYPLVACFQQLMRGEEAYGLTGANVVLEEGVIKLINVKAKNHR
jgi:hypothetical protein